MTHHPPPLKPLALFFNSLAALALLLAGEAFAHHRQTAPSLTLHSLTIKGARVVPAKEVREALSLALPPRWPWQPRPEFKPEDLENDLERLKVFYRRQGFYHATIDSHLEIDEQGRVKVVLSIKEGPMVVVRQVKVTVKEPYAELDFAEIQRKSPVTVGIRFTERAYEELKALYLTHLQDHGHPRGRLESKVFLDEEQNTAEVHLTIFPGPVCYFGEVRLIKEADVPDYIILRKLTFKRGELFSFKQLYDSQRRLYDTDLFRSVNLTPAQVPETECHIPVVLEVHAGKRGSVKVGLGFGAIDLFRARLALRLRNLAGGGRLLDLEGKYSLRENRIMGTFTNPQVFASRFDFVLQGGWVQWDLPGFKDQAYFTQARLERDLPWNLRGYVGYGLEFARPFGIPDETLIILKDLEQGRLYTASMAMLGLRRDTTDDPLNPTRGLFMNLTQEVSADFLGGNLQFSRTVTEAKGYRSLGSAGLVMAGRLKFGFIEPIQGTEEIPLFRRFFAGGFGSVRGYRFNYLGPRNSAGTPIGGEALLEGNIELRMPLYREFQGIAFFDFGNVYLKLRDVDPGQFKYASGVGLRYLTAIGPIGLDIGFPLNRIDPRQDPPFQLVFSIGQQF